MIYSMRNTYYVVPFVLLALVGECRSLLELKHVSDTQHATVNPKKDYQVEQ